MVTFFLFNQTDSSNQAPVLKERLGTILWQFSHNNLSTLTGSYVYCYYPFDSTQYENRGGENIIKQEETIYDCSGWFGVMTSDEQNISSL